MTLVFLIVLWLWQAPPRSVLTSIAHISHHLFIRFRNSILRNIIQYSVKRHDVYFNYIHECGRVQRGKMSFLRLDISLSLSFMNIIISFNERQRDHDSLILFTNDLYKLILLTQHHYLCRRRRRRRRRTSFAMRRSAKVFRMHALN